MKAFQQFSAATDLKENPRKCKVYFGGTHEMEKRKIMKITNFEEGQLPFKYLGAPLTSRKISISQCQPLIDKIVAKIRHWTSKLLSSTGRCQLVKRTLFVVAACWMQVFPLPKKIIHQVEAVCRSFLWSGNEDSIKAPIVWDKVCDPRCPGVLNITALKDWNKATMLKLFGISMEKKTNFG
ncbi:uncharacterized protein LOC131621798 [Vicia villosa]|uniref:uncharacterized protein LOC131621798 n=1 Tax=Vicia villosa TaxID=3911 RepID=UPI00273C8CA9|nr:uncharacterized protein LOC131621798 [Vicia villosa]